jgi:predicted HTH transcriptional regulator
VGDIEILQQIPVRSDKFKRIALKLNDYTELAELKYVLNHPVLMEENRHCEFKEIKSSAGAVSSIVNTSDEYAIAFLNSEGGSIFWGIRNNDRAVMGVPLNYEQRDKVRRDAHAKLSTIEPRIDPSQYRLEMHDIHDELGAKVADICIVELIVPRSNSVGPYYTGGGDAWVKVDGSKQKLKGPALTDFIVRLRTEKADV